MYLNGTSCENLLYNLKKTLRYKLKSVFRHIFAARYSISAEI